METPPSEEESRKMKLSPAARLFQSPRFNCYVVSIIGCNSTIDPDIIKDGLTHTLLKHPRFSSKLVRLRFNSHQQKKKGKKPLFSLSSTSSSTCSLSSVLKLAPKVEVFCFPFIVSFRGWFIYFWALKNLSTFLSFLRTNQIPEPLTVTSTWNCCSSGKNVKLIFDVKLKLGRKKQKYLRCSKKKNLDLPPASVHNQFPQLITNHN